MRSGSAPGIEKAGRAPGIAKNGDAPGIWKYSRGKGDRGEKKVSAAGGELRLRPLEEKALRYFPITRGARSSFSGVPCYFLRGSESARSADAASEGRNRKISSRSTHPSLPRSPNLGRFLYRA